MNTSTSLVCLHLAGEGEKDLTLDTLPGKFTLTRTDAALTAYGGLVAWSGFLTFKKAVRALAKGSE